MNTKAWILTIASSLLLACSSNPASSGGWNDPGTNGDNSSSGASSSGSNSGSGGGGSGGGTSSSGSSGTTSGGGSGGGGSSSGSSGVLGDSGVVFRDAGGGGIIGNADRLVTLIAYELRGNSALAHAGLDLGALGVMWDAYHFANDGFLDRFFNVAPMDFYGDMLPVAGSRLFSVGADQVGSGA